ncbi:acyl transferase [Nostoc sp. 106C]|uniref:acyl transferase n=1 Tax=Nostoc sp. 106C TaxID=1932667 RepID=UPI001FB74F48|nr:acyl transferase [Nostoc sp. 106C]
MLLSIYGLPVIVYRWHQWVYPVPEGITYLCGKEYSPWWGSHQIQVIYITIPVLEAVLRLIPGAFSFWLRLWGAKVGRNVYWTPGLEIADRGLLEIGDRVIMGHRVGISSHVIKPRKQNLMLYVKKVKIGNDVFVGAGSIFAPGVVIGDGTFLTMATNLSPNQQVP